jgi:hypothetical protein
LALFEILNVFRQHKSTFFFNFFFLGWVHDKIICPIMCWLSPYMEILGVRAGRFVRPKKKNDITKICTCEKGCPRVGPHPQPIFFFFFLGWPKSSNRRILWFCYPFLKDSHIFILIPKLASLVSYLKQCILALNFFSNG